jgi:hypothetical protein
MTNNTAYVTYNVWHKPSWKTKTFSADQKIVYFMEIRNSFRGHYCTTMFPVRRLFNKWEQVLSYNIPKFKTSNYNGQKYIQEKFCLPELYLNIILISEHWTF